MPSLIDLHALAGKVHKHPILIVREGLSSVHKELKERGAANARKAA